MAVVAMAQPRRIPGQHHQFAHASSVHYQHTIAALSSGPSTDHKSVQLLDAHVSPVRAANERCHRQKRERAPIYPGPSLLGRRASVRLVT